MNLYLYGKIQHLLPPCDFNAEIQVLQEELLNERDRHLRTIADFKNYRRRIERNINKIAEESKREMLLAMLDIIDDIEKALQYANDTKQQSVEGLRIIHKKFIALLKIHGVCPFECVDMPFNHNLHEAVVMAKQESSESGTVVDVLRRGYLWNNELLRRAQVR